MTKKIIYHDKNNKELSFNDYVKVYTSNGIHTGYINFFQNGIVRVNCLADEFRVRPEKIELIAKINS